MNKTQPWIEKQICQTCKGTGKVDGNFYLVSTFPLSKRPDQTCCTCDGTGEVEVEVKVR
jgi:DnaJ-class molecular chaperone